MFPYDAAGPSTSGAAEARRRRRRRVGLNKILVLPGVVTLGILEQGRCEGEECIPRCEVRTGDSGVAATVRAYELLYCKRTWGDRTENNSTVYV